MSLVSERRTVVARRRRARGFEHNQLGVTFYRSGALDLAIERFELATRRAPWVSSYWLNLGVAFLDKGILGKAEAAIKRALELDNKSQSAYFHLAKLHEKREDEAAAREAYEKAIELDPRTHLAQRARERLEEWHPRLLGMPNSGERS
ncbi:tetratricopeptide repeat protein [Pyrinomonas methylaliphatogenes]|uniref:tetratricopeptide repeat protein n=1 Tax=Pyrinomonas methylaliphatogenes TaxID=454194 RepID=UPI0005AA9823|nr:tetratricopeptide repeat protein [Pyrinomonas methylaliphatogenes]